MLKIWSIVSVFLPPAVAARAEQVLAAVSSASTQPCLVALLAGERLEPRLLLVKLRLLLFVLLLLLVAWSSTEAELKLLLPLLVVLEQLEKRLDEKRLEAGGTADALHPAAGFGSVLPNGEKAARLEALAPSG